MSELFEKLCSFENLHLAYHKARKGKRKKASVASFESSDHRSIRSNGE